MKFISTRGGVTPVDFTQVLTQGLAPDGGLYVPETWPSFTVADIQNLKGLDFEEVAARIVHKYANGVIDLDELRGMSAKAYAGFTHPHKTPLMQTGDQDWILELFHGPTLAFKDVAMQFLGVLFDHVLAQQSRRIAIIGATSGDTGAAAIEAFRDKSMIDVFILHPKGRVSDVQRRIMTSVDAPNIYNIAVNGTFDDCQRIVKSLFADRELKDHVEVSGVNSINWVRLAVQIVYYFTAAVELGAPDRKFSFVAPTGNFGDIFAGYAAKRMGLPIEFLCVAVNENDILHRALTSGEYKPETVAKTITPSMDIQVASNFERLVYEASGRNASVTKSFMNDVSGDDGAVLPAPLLANIRAEFLSERAGSEETSAAMKQHFKTHGGLIDPHTAVGVAVADKLRATGKLTGDVITLSTAHPAKFPEAVIEATGETPKLPEKFSDLFLRPEYFVETEANIDDVRNIMISSMKSSR